MDEKTKVIKISKDNPSIELIKEKCIDCGLCSYTCKDREGIENLCDGKNCVDCGQCIQVCPVGALIPKQDKYKFEEALNSGKICIAYTAPSVRVAIGDEFGLEKGEFAQGKLISALRKLGFKYVLDVTFGADLTIMEEASDLVDRLKNNGKLPMFTSCCPSWVKYAELFYPEILDNLSTCKSPIGMTAQIVRKYFIPKYNLDKNNVYTVAITPCTSKKFEISREEIEGTDLVLTTREISNMLKEKNINLRELEDGEFDSLLGEGSGAGMIFGNTGGVMEATLRTAYNVITGKDLEIEKLELKEVRGLENVKECTIKMGKYTLNVATVNKMSAATTILEDVKKGKSKYHFIEIMNCLGGCIGGGGQPKILPTKELEVKNKRINSLYERDSKDKIRVSYKNPDIIRVYDEFIGYPLSFKAKEMLHTRYTDRSNK